MGVQANVPVAVLPSDVLNDDPLGSACAGAMCTTLSRVGVEAASEKLTRAPVLTLNFDWSAGVGDAHSTDVASLFAAGTSSRRANIAATNVRGRVVAGRVCKTWF